MAATRIYILAKELGVKSSAVVKKCQDEGLDVKNHMSAISAGLAATIREWFSEGENVTTIETTEKVDLTTVRVKRKKAKQAEAEADSGDTQTEVAVAEPVAEEETAVVSEADTEDTDEAESTTAEIMAPAGEEPEGAPAEAEADEEEDEPDIDKPAPPSGPIIVEAPPEPEEVLPAGPMLEKPKPAKLSGPQVVRIEKPEPLRAPRQRSARPRYDRPVTQPLMGGGSTTGAGEGKSSGKGAAKKGKDRTHGRRRGEVTAEETAKRPTRGRKMRQRDIDERQARLEAAGGEGMRTRLSRKLSTKANQGTATSRPKSVTISEPILVKDLSAALAVKVSDIMGKLMQQGVMATANQVISGEVAELVALEFETELIVEYQKAEADEIKIEFDNRERKHLKRRPVVGAMLGHVDHGKTSLLDRIRSSQVAAGEAGGITQHIGASQVKLGDKVVTFIDTPGHEAFTAMRARGANMTDVVVLVVAADDGVMPQTAEAIAHSKAAEVPIIVALNKIDLPGVDLNRIYAQLSEHELTPTEWGGETEVVKTSAITGEGIEDLLEHIDYIAELKGFEADDTIAATGWVLEARMSQKRGSTATILVKEGCLKKGDVLLAGTAFGRVKQLKNSFGKSVKAATSSMPVEVTGLSGVPQAGDRFYCLGNDIKRAQNAAEQRQQQSREESLAKRSQVTLDNLFSQIEAGNVKELKLILRADVQGSVDVLRKYLTELNTDEVKINILHGAAGGITEGDVILAEASNAIIIGFNVVSDERAAKSAESKGVDIRLYNIIYRITEDLKQSMAGLLDPEEKEESLGRATVRMPFKVTGVGTVAGCYVTTGVVARSAKVRLIRNNIVLRDNINVDSLKHFKDDAKEVKSGFECGIKLAGFDDVKTDDVLEFYKIVKIARTLD
ncbi:translation initiation factor IF-2 [Planctomycetota bacterium]